MSHQPAPPSPASLDAAVVDPALPPRPLIGHACLSAFSDALRAVDCVALAAELDLHAAWFTDRLAELVGAAPGRLRRVLRGPQVEALVRLLTRAAGAFALEQVFAEDEDLPRLQALAEQAGRVASALGAAPELPRRRGRPWAVEAVLDEDGRGALALPRPAAPRAR